MTAALVLPLVNAGYALAVSPTSAPAHQSDAIAHYQKQLRSNPDDNDQRMQLAEAYEMRGDVGRAKEQALKVIANDRNNSAALILLGRISSHEQDWTKAKVYYQRAVRVDKANAEAYLGLGQALMELGDEAEADAAFGDYRRIIDTGTAR